MPDITMTSTQSGPFFKKGSEIVDKVTQQFVQRMVELGEQRLDQVLKPKPDPGVYLSVNEARPNKASTGNYRRNVSGRVRNLDGRIDDGGVVYGAWLEGTSSRNSANQFPGYAAFRKTGDWLQKQVEPTRDEFMKEYARRLNGI